MRAQIRQFDRRVDAAVESRRSPALDRVFYLLSSAADHSLLWLIIGAARSLRHGDLRFATRFAAAMGFESALTNGAVKAAFNRGRPIVPHAPAGPLPYGLHQPITSSFPSGHATAAFTAVTLLRGRHRTPWYLLAAAVASSRVYVRMHHASDVIGGAALGLLLGRLLRRWVRSPH